MSEEWEVFSTHARRCPAAYGPREEPFCFNDVRATLPVTHHGNGIGGQQLLRTHGRDIGDVGEDIDEGHQGDGDEDGTWEVPGNGEPREHEVGLQERKLSF